MVLAVVEEGPVAINRDGIANLVWVDPNIKGFVPGHESDTPISES
jgi:hypothetical protein